MSEHITLIDQSKVKDAIVGLSEQEARYYLDRNSVTYRIKKRDDVAYLHTQDWKVERANLTIIGGVVSYVSWG